jgi:competence protein ComEA
MEQLLSSLLSNPKLPLVLCLLGVVLIIGGLFSSGLASNFLNKPAASYSKESLVPTNQLSQIKIDVSGAVNKPGVYSLDSGARMEDVIKAAGGFSSKVNQEFVAKSLNLSQKISDGQKIYIPLEGEQASVVIGAAVNGAASSTNGLIGINSASTDQLDSLPGVGPVTSQKIVSGRPYSSLEDLTTKKIVSKSVFNKIKDLVDLN